MTPYTFKNEDNAELEDKIAEGEMLRAAFPAFPKGNIHPNTGLYTGRFAALYR